LLPVLFTFLVNSTLRETFGRFPKFNALQLIFILILQLFGIMIPFFLGIKFRASVYVSVTVITVVTIIYPMLQIQQENTRRIVFRKARFVEFTRALRVEHELERQLSETKKQLHEFQGKLQLTDEQIQIVEDNYKKFEAEGLDAFLVDIDHEVEFVEKIGRGSFGIVYAARFRETKVAVKQILGANLSKTLVDMFSSEIIMLAHLKHPNIITFYAYCWKAPNLAIILEYAHNGDLSAYLRKRMSLIKWGNNNRHSGRLSFLRDIVQGMRYLHKRPTSVMHRDLKLENCLVTKFNVVKLTDFGGSREIASGAESMSNLTVVGTHAYVAPEVMNGDAYGMKCDVFSFAIVLCCLGVYDGSPSTMYIQSLGREKEKKKTESGGGQNYGLHLVSMHTKGQRLSLDAFEWPSAMKDLIRTCWDHDPGLRPTFDDIAEEVNTWRARDFGEVDGNVVEELPPRRNESL
jgi:hypothetical protein